MNPQRQSPTTPPGNTPWPRLCTGAIMGWLVLGAFTALTFRLLQGDQFYLSDSIIVVMFKIVEGGFLGVATTLAIKHWQEQDYKKAAKVAFCCSAVVCCFWLILMFFGNSPGANKAESLKGLVCWGGATLIWGVLLLLWGLKLWKKEKTLL